MHSYTFANPEYFYLLLLLIPMIGWYIYRHRQFGASLKVSTLEGLKKAPITYKHILRHLLFVFRVFAIALIIVALARPQSSSSRHNVKTEGIDIVLALDVSSTMLAKDFNPDRIEAAKRVAIEFISGRPNDRIGLVIFSGQSFTQCPLTTDRTTVINLFKDIRSGVLEDGTAIGNGLATAVARLKESQAASKVVLLLTDGENNMGEVPPLTAAEIAKTFGVRVYTIGVGSLGTAPYPFQTPYGIQFQNVEVKIDEGLLKQIAHMTGGQYYRATNNKKLVEIYQEIDRLEKSKIDISEVHRKYEVYHPYVLAAGLLLILSLLLKYTLLRNIP
ncbi:MAG: VWA domain-containing protein [Bacteroidota bacterium]|nr:VWA domain-containing protein [Bacteroidota bacterium]